jgi:transcriptional regulator with XRE-family HTH domain
MSTKRPKSEARKILEKLTGGPLTLGRALRAIRLGEEQSLSEFAKILSISASHLSDIELGRKTVSAERAAKFARRLRRSEEQFVRLALQDLVSQAGLKFRVNLNAA